MRAFTHVGHTIVLTLHSPEEADTLASRVSVIDHGRIIADGTPGAIKGRDAARKINFAA